MSPGARGAPAAARRVSEAGLLTERLELRRWREADLDAFAAINADAEVMEHFPATLSRAQSAALIARIEACFEAHGYGLWALELREDGALAGFTGLAPVESAMAFAPSVEIGWRLARERWGRGLAHEAALAVIERAFGELGLEELVAYTAARNARSRRLMGRLGMRRDPAEDFAHPRLAAGDPLAAHVLYRLAAPAQRQHRGARAPHPA